MYTAPGRAVFSTACAARYLEFSNKLFFYQYKTKTPLSDVLDILSFCGRRAMEEKGGVAGEHFAIHTGLCCSCELTGTEIQLSFPPLWCSKSLGAGSSSKA